MKKLLLTSFEPFGGQAINPSREAARAMMQCEFPGAQIVHLDLPVARSRAVEMLLAAIERESPDVVLMLGEAGGRAQVTPERVAINVDDFPIPDNSGEQPRNEPIAPDGPAAYFSTLPIHAIVQTLQNAKIPAAISNSAGTYLCNRAFYSVMHHLATKGNVARAGFVHVPFLEEQVATKNSVILSLARKTLYQAVRLTIETCLGESSEGGFDTDEHR